MGTQANQTPKVTHNIVMIVLKQIVSHLHVKELESKRRHNWAEIWLPRRENSSISV